MKRGTPEHPKMTALAEMLGITRAHAVGIMEMLWHYTGRFSPRGDVGKWSNAQIAKGAGWDRDPEELIAALLAVNFIDQCDEHRLLIHDWPEHADENSKKYLRRNNIEFITRRVQKTAEKGGKCPPRIPDISATLAENGGKSCPSRAPEVSESESESESETQFRLFWTSYPNQVNYEDAMQSWLSLWGTKITKQSVHEVFEGLARYKNSTKWAEDGGKYIPSPKTFLVGNDKKRGGMWKDYPPQRTDTEYVEPLFTGFSWMVKAND